MSMFATKERVKKGRVDLVGCGPGDPELLTLKALRCIGQADVLVVDRLVPAAILAFARPGVRRIDVGKTPYTPSIPQDEINRILVREALKGFRVARLKGGDPFVFGRAAEELAALRAAGVTVDVVPGVTAALACAAGVSLPVTVRGKVQQFSILTGATAAGELDLDWTALARDHQAFAIYMGVAAGPTIAERLLTAGAPPSRPVVIVENGACANEFAVETTLGSLAAAIRELHIKGPAVIFVGLHWQQADLSRPEHVVTFAQASPTDCDHEKPEPESILHADAGKCPAEVRH